MIGGRGDGARNQILLAPTAAASIAGRRSIPGVCAVSLGGRVPCTTRGTLRSVFVAIVRSPCPFTGDETAPIGHVRQEPATARSISP